MRCLPTIAATALTALALSIANPVTAYPMPGRAELGPRTLELAERNLNVDEVHSLSRRAPFGMLSSDPFASDKKKQKEWAERKAKAEKDMERQRQRYEKERQKQEQRERQRLGQGSSMQPSVQAVEGTAAHPRPLAGQDVDALPSYIPPNAPPPPYGSTFGTSPYPSNA
ncbi:hypothetical protein K474DRAFT_698672 [Panus rudis PR-1116 ss-1]|nr:hypothetical protein K474DRAFT_698672 [Panus rudis PR-1116 ss-1]